MELRIHNRAARWIGASLAGGAPIGGAQRGIGSTHDTFSHSTGHRLARPLASHGRKTKTQRTEQTKIKNRIKEKRKQKKRETSMRNTTTMTPRICRRNRLQRRKRLIVTPCVLSHQSTGERGHGWGARPCQQGNPSGLLAGYPATLQVGLRFNNGRRRKAPSELERSDSNLLLSAQALNPRQDYVACWLLHSCVWICVCRPCCYSLCCSLLLQLEL